VCLLGRSERYFIQQIVQAKLFDAASNWADGCVSLGLRHVNNRLGQKRNICHRRTKYHGKRKPQLSAATALAAEGKTKHYFFLFLIFDI
jgi:hypothetical protein